MAQVIDNLVIPKASGKGIKVDAVTPTWGWRDLVSDISVKGGANTPTWATFRGAIDAFQFDIVNDEVWNTFHIPHDYCEGSELFIHTHWGLITADTTNSITWEFDASYQKRNDAAPAAFPATVNKAVTHDCSAINVPQYGHVVSEVQLTTSGQLSAVDIEVDGLVLVRTILTADAAGIEPFLFFVDIHYQSTNIGTKDKAFPYFG